MPPSPSHRRSAPTESSQGVARSRSSNIRAALLLSFMLLLAACGSGSGAGGHITPTIAFTSTPVTTAAEGSAYSYQAAATASDASAVTFALTTGPAGATLSGDLVSWTPTHAESRISNTFTVAASTASGGSATQSWTVTPNGTVNITAITYWTPSGSINMPPQWLPDLPYPAALVPQSDGSVQRLQGAANADGSFSIPNVPGGYYWLQINPNANYWTSTSEFDDGSDVVGAPQSTTAQNTTTFQFFASGLDAPTQQGDLVTVHSDVRQLSPVITGVIPGSTTAGDSLSLTSNVDWSKISTLYISTPSSTCPACVLSDLRKPLAVFLSATTQRI